MSEGTATTDRAIVNCAVIEAPPEKVFAAFTTADSLAKFFATSAEFDGRWGGQWKLVDTNYPHKSTGSGTVTGWEPPNLVRMDWSWYKTNLHPTQVTYRILPHEKGSLLIIQHHGWGAGSDWDYEFSDHSEGWPKVVSQAAAFLGAALIWVSPGASAKPDQQTWEVLKTARDRIQAHYDTVVRDREEIQRRLDRLKKSTGVVRLTDVDALEKEFDKKDDEARRLELDLRDVELLMK
jgi:uncharacterized protein YndB with AHSA1/START domain